MSAIPESILNVYFVRALEGLFKAQIDLRMAQSGLWSKKHLLIRIGESLAGSANLLGTCARRLETRREIC